VILIDNRNNSDPYINAAIEEHMVREMQSPDEDLVLLYINTPCVVVGKNQCIYREVNFGYLREHGTIIRRLSGGGTVYHDEGNLCFAFVSHFHDSKINNYQYFNDPIVKILQEAGIDAASNSRNDIVWKGKKISGNAQFTDRKNVLSHGTILVNADLDKLRFALKENPFTIETKAVSSVRTPVMNILEGSDTFQTAQQLKQHFLKELPITRTISFTDNDWQSIIDTANIKFRSDHWIWGRNPYTKITKDSLILEIENGIVIQSTDENLVGKLFTGEDSSYLL
jgi:lipoate-protein ligase A